MALVAAGVSTARVVTGCLERPTTEELLEQPVVVTKRDPNMDFFTSLSTFAITDTIPLLASFDAGASRVTVDPAIADPTLGEIAAQLSSRGYRQVEVAEHPDFGVAVTAVNQLRVRNVAYGGWWGAGAASSSYWGYYGAPFVAPISYATVAWQSGTLLIELYDLRAARDEARRSSVTPTFAVPAVTAPIEVVWVAIIHGVVGAVGESLEAPPIEQVRQAFAQSPYLVRPRTRSEPL